MQSKPTITVGFSAHNEAKNIKQILIQVLNQTQKSWTLKEILVYCDGCTDKTAELARSLKEDVIKVVDDGKRLGKVGRTQQMFADYKGDIFVLFDADLKLIDNNVIEHLVQPFINDKDVMLVGGNTQPFAPKTFFEKAVYSTFIVFQESRRTMKNGHNIFGCNGGCIAIRRKFSDEIQFPNVINEDDYLYFSCLKKGYTFRHVPEAVVFYKLPKKLTDYLKQNFRSNPEAVVLNFNAYFGDLVEKEYHRPLSFYARAIGKAFIQNPIGVIYITTVNILAKPFIPFISKRFKLSWYTAASTK